LGRIAGILKTIATAAAVAFVVFSCKGKLSEADRLDLSKTPVQSVEDMFFVQTENGVLKIRVEAPLMQKFENDTASFDLFPKGVAVYAYSPEGDLETIILAEQARHDRGRNRKSEIWAAYGNVRVKNTIKQETMETDTLYWNQSEKEIYTDCYVRMSSPSGFMQGYGMRSDEMARNANILSPFDSYGVLIQDTTKVVIDSANFIGPLLRPVK
jgi:LPS export ABC transporter protein LptC